MAKINQVILCRACNNELPYPVPEICPSCNTKIAPTDNATFGSPSYLTYQFEDELEVAKEESDHISKREGDSIPKSRVLEQKEKVIKDDLAAWLKTCPDSDRIASADDTVLMAQFLLESGMTYEAMSKFAALCKQAHEIAQAALKFVDLKGYRHVRTTPAPAPGDDRGDQENPPQSSDPRD